MPQLLRIGELSKRSGVSPELLRAWERHYRLLEPARSAGSPISAPTRRSAPWPRRAGGSRPRWSCNAVSAERVAPVAGDPVAEAERLTALAA